MTSPRRRIASELLAVVLIFASLAGSLALIVDTYRRRPAPIRSTEPVEVASVQLPPPAETPPSVVLPPVSEPEHEPGPSPEPSPPEDPAPAVLARLATETAAEGEAAARVSARVDELEAELRSVEAVTDRWEDREGLMRTQSEGLRAKTHDLEAEAETLALERDVLVRRRDALRDDLLKAQARAQNSHAILPYRGPTGTWQRPIAIECRDGTATIQPDGISFSIFDLSNLGNPRSSPFVAALARQMMKVRGTTGPDGSAVVPYILFLVRPDGIRPYYEARARLEPLGITFGYELVEQDQEIEFPALDDASVWADATAADPASAPGAAWPGPPGGAASVAGREADGLPIWPTAPGGIGGVGGGGGGLGGPQNPLQRALNGPSYRRAQEPFERGDTPGGFGGFADANPAGGPPGSHPGRVEILPGGQTFGGLGPESGSGLGSGAGSGTAHTPPASQSGTGPFASGGSADGPFGSSSASTNPGQSRVEGVDLDRSGFGGASGPAGPADLEGISSFAPSGAIPAERAGGGSAGEGRGGGDGSPSRGGPESAGGLAGGIPAGLGQSGSEGAREGHPSAGGGSMPGGQACGGGQPSLGGSPGGVAGDGSGNQGQAIGKDSDPYRPWHEQTLELVVTCDRWGVRIHPTDERLGAATLRERDGFLVDRLREIVWARREAEPEVFWVPRLRFVVEPFGQQTYREVRRQTIMAGTGWPILLQVVDGDRVRLSLGERR